MHIVTRLRRAISWLLNVPSADSGDARRRRLLNILLVGTVVLVLVGFFATLIGLKPPPLNEKLFYWSMPAMLFGAVLIFAINRYGWGWLARLLFLLVLVASVLVDSLVQGGAGYSLLAASIPIFVASFLLRPYASFIMAGMVSLLITSIDVGLLGADLNVSAMLTFFLIALASWITARSLEHALTDLRDINRELDQRVAQRTQDLERRSIQLQTASEVARDATATLDIEELLDETVYLISERFGFYHAGVFLVDERGGYAVLRAASKSEGGQRMLERGHKLAVGKEGIVGHVAGTGEPLVVLDVGRDAVHYVNPDLPDTRSEMALPLISRGRVIGVLDVQSTEKNIFTREDVAALQTMADQLANAIENARLYEQVQARSRYLETLQRVNATLRTTLPLSQVLETIVQGVTGTFNYAGSLIAIPDAARERLVLGAVWGSRFLDAALKFTGVTLSSFSLPLAAEENPITQAYLGGKLQAWSRGPERIVVGIEPAISPKVASAIERAMKARLAACIPLPVGDRVVGVLIIFSSQEELLDEEQAMLFGLAGQAGLAIENARLYEEARRHVEELTALHTIDVAMTSTLDLDKVLQTIFEQVREIMDIASFYIALYDEKRDEIHVSLMVDQGEYLQPFTSKVGKDSGFAGWVVRNRQPLWVDDVEKERDELPVERVTIGKPMRSFMVLPLIFRDRVIGVISAQSPESCAFDEDDRQLFSGIAHQAAIAITNAQLYEEVRRRLAEAMLVQEVMLAAASTLDFDLVLERTVKALHRALSIDYLGFLLPEEVDGAMVPHPSLVGFEDRTSRIPIEGSLVGRAYRTGRPALVRDGMHESDYVERSPEIRSALAVPVRVGDRTVAVLRAESAAGGTFGEDELRLFTTVAGQLGVTLENARLYQEMARYTRDLRMLAGASAGMIGSLEPQEIADHLLAALIERFHAACDISLVEPDEEDIKLVAGWMPGDQPFPLPSGHRMRISEHGGLSHVMEARQLVYIPDVEQSEWWTLVSEQEREIARVQGIKAALILPMVGQGRLVGVVSLRFLEPLPEPVEDQLDWAQTLVNQAAAALGNAQLYQRLEAQATELSRAYDELQEIDSLRTQLVQNVGHELRTPLSLIQGYVELLMAGDLGRVLESQRAALQIIRERTATLSRLIHNLMMLQAVPREALALAPVSVVEIVRHVLTEFRRSAEEGGIVFREELPQGLPPTLGDRERLELVFGHLVDNAIKFSPDGGTITLRAWADDEEKVYVSVSDEGVGIPPEHLGRVFERFYQVNGSTKRRFGGMGIGLALAWEIVEAHGGTIRVESEPGKGSSFTVVLPRADVT